MCPAGRPPEITKPLARPPVPVAPAPPHHSWPAAPAISQKQLKISVGNTCQSVGGHVFSERSEASVGGFKWNYDNPFRCEGIGIIAAQVWILTMQEYENTHHFWESNGDVLVRLLEGKQSFKNS